MNANVVSLILQNLMCQLPMILVVVVACIVTILSWQKSPAASTFALLGFGLTLLLCFAIPVTQSLIQSWMAENPEKRIGSIRFVTGGISILWSLLRAASYGLLLAAVYAGRSEPPSAPITYPPVPPAPPR